MKSITLLIIDESGSMHGMEGFVNETINGIIQQIKTELKDHPDLKQYLEIWTFEGRNVLQKLPFAQVSLNEIPENIGYRTGGATPLYDAMGRSLTGIKNRVEMIESFRESQVNVAVITDGLENSSREFSGIQIRSLVLELQERSWNIEYYGADHDVTAAAESMGIRDFHRFSKSKEGFSSMKSKINRKASMSKQEYMEMVRRKKGL